MLLLIEYFFQTANCERAGYSMVPSQLSNEIQDLNLDENAVTFLEKDAFKRVNFKISILIHYWNKFLP